MNQGLLIRWKGESVEWLIHDAGQPIQEGQGSIEALSEVLAAMDPPLVDPEAAVLISGQEALITEITVPSKPTRQLLDAIPFLVEEQVVGSIDDHFIGLGRREGDQLSVVVLRQEIMRSVIDAFDQASIRVEFIGVDSQLLQHENMIRLLVEEDMVHVIQPHGVGVAMAANLAEQLIPSDLVTDSVPIECLDFSRNGAMVTSLVATSSPEVMVLSASDGTIEPGLLRYWARSGNPLAVNLRQGVFAYRSSRLKMATLIKGGLLVVLTVLGTQLAANLAQAFYLTNQADQLGSEARALYLSVYPASQAPRNMARLWRARLSGTGNENESTVLALIDRLSTTVTQSGISVQNLNFNAARGDLSMQLTGRTSDQIMRLSESMGAMGLQAEIGTISQEGDDVRATVRVKGL